MKRLATAIMAFGVLWPVTAIANEHPEVWGPGPGEFRWVSAAWALEDDGSVATAVPQRLRAELEHRMLYFDENSTCPTPPLPQWPIAEDWGRFDAAVLLSDVAVTASVEAVLLGFAQGGSPAALVVLADVVTLHEKSYQPRYVLVPLNRTVIRGRAFCGNETKGKYRPTVGTRIVVIGSLSDSGVVPLGRVRAGSIATVGEDGTVSWRWLDNTGPLTLGDLHAKAHELASGGLWEIVSELRWNRESPEAQMARVEFGRSLDGLNCDSLRVFDSMDGPTIGCKPALER